MRSTSLPLAAIGLFTLLVLPGTPARGQAVPAAIPPFFNAVPNIFDPEIDIVETGTLLDAQAVVSDDRKYVTLTMRPQVSTLVALREFTFQRGQNFGPVGFPPPAQNNAPNDANGNGNAAPDAREAAAAAAARAVRPAVLDRPGMTRIEPRAR